MTQEKENEKKIARAAEDLEFIRRVMEATRKRSLKNGVFYQLWGVLIPVCSLLNLLLLKTGNHGAIGPAWGIVMGLGTISSFIMGFLRSGGDSEHKDRQLNGRVWMGILLGSVTVMILILLEIIPIVYGLFALCLLLMLGSVVEASLTGLRGFFIVGLGWLIIGIVLVVLPGNKGPMIMGLMTFPLSFIPGTILTVQYKKERGQSRNG